jgi:AcrR family transcriptional regulator
VTAAEGSTSRDDGAPADSSTRERILDIALELFTEQGYERTSLRQIAERLGFSKAAIYYHFASKEDILMTLHLRLHEFG